jgi:GT2 family glycosyltransferase/glycosyltransferase involved in cell wall biosynthesis
MVNRPDAYTVPGGDTVQMLRTKEALERRGIEVDVSLDAEPDGLGRYDVIHVFNLQNPDIQLKQILALRKAGLPIALSTIFWDHKEFDWARQVIAGAFGSPPEGRAALLKALAERDVAVNGQRWNTPIRGSEAYVAAQLEVVKNVDLLLPNSHAEARNLAESLDIEVLLHGAGKMPALPGAIYKVVPNGIDVRTFSTASPKPFFEKFGIRDFVLVAARWDERKNLALLAAALADTGLPLVLAGNRPYPEYEALVRSLLPATALILDHLEPEMLASAYAAARVHALPSWFETPGLANLEAALAGCAIVVGDRAAEREYFGEAAYYCDPANIARIKHAVLAAWESGRQNSLREKILTDYTWENAADATIAAYQALQETRGPILPRANVTIRVSGAIPAAPKKVASAAKSFAASIIIPCWNRIDMTRRCLEAIAANTPDELNFELVLVDNGSEDGTLEFLESLEGDVQIIANEDNLGFARACNQGARAAKGDVLVFLNNDTVPQAGWLGALLDTIRHTPRIGAVGAKLLLPDGRIQHAGVTLGLDACPFHWMYKAQDDPLVDQVRDFQAVTAACLAIDKALFHSQGGFDEGFVNGYEDVDLCLKLRAAGYRVRYQPQARVIHEESQSFGRKEAEDANYARLSERWKDKLLPDWSRYEAMMTGHAASHSIVVVSYNSESTISQCIASALTTLGPTDEIIVVDNASRDGTVDIVRAFKEADKRVRLLECPVNLGFSEGCNVGLRAATGEYLVLLNPDTVVTSGWLERMAAQFKGDPLTSRVGAVGPTSNYVAGKQKINHYIPEEKLAGRLPAEIAAMLADRKAQGIETRLLIGFCLMLHRAVLEEIGLLDKALFLGMDDLDISWRLALAGYKLMVATDAFVGHVGQVSFKTEPEGRTRRLTQDATNILCRKLEAHYGRGHVPPARELWGVDWIKPDFDLWGPKPTTFRAAGDDWPATLAAYLDAFEPADPVTLEIAAEGQAVLSWLSDKGYDPDKVPDIDVRDTFEAATGTAAVLLGTAAPDIAPHIVNVTPQALRESCGYRPPYERERLTSIVILTRNARWCTTLCLHSIRHHTVEPYELVIVDNGSSDGTQDYLRRWAEEYGNVTLIFNEENKGFAGGCNQGIAASRGDHILLLNNDIVVSDGWLTRLVRHLDDPRVGIVGPRTNYVVGPQLVRNVPYDQLSLLDFDDFARDWARKNAARGQQVDMAVGFCLLLRGELVNQIGGLDPRFGTGNFEDDDYCLRAQIAGYKVVVADDCFVHHFGSQSFAAEQKVTKLDYGDLMAKNRTIFMDKWAAWIDVDGKPELASVMAHLSNLGRQFTIDELLVPLPDPAAFTYPARRAPIEGLCGLNLVFLPDWEGPGWESIVSAFATTFDSRSDVALIMPSPPREAFERLTRLLASEGSPDVLLVEEKVWVADLVYTAQGVITTEDSKAREVSHLAKLLGRPTLLDPDTGALRTWQDSFRTALAR